MNTRNLSQHQASFLLLWAGQTVSLLGSSLTSFALGIWIYDRTGRATPFALIALAGVLPRLIFAPFAGALVDRWDRRWAMLVSDSGAALVTLAQFLLLAAGHLEVWHIYLAAAVGALFGSLQYPAYAAAVTLLVPKDQLGRANGLVQLGQAAGEILAPSLGGVLVVWIKVQGVMAVDFATYLFAVLCLLAVRVSLRAGSVQKTHFAHSHVASHGSLAHDALEGWAYLRSQPGLLGLVFFFAVGSFVWSMFSVLVRPVVLAFASPEEFGLLLTVAGAGMLAGSLLMSAWGGPKRRVLGIICFEAVSGLGFILIGLQPSLIMVGLGAFVAHLTIAILNGTNLALWQSKVPPSIQGRAFATQEALTRLGAPLAYLLAGPLADQVFTPLLAPGGLLAGSVGAWIGVGAGHGIGLLVVMLGVVKVLVSVGGYFYAPVRLWSSSEGRW